MKSGTRRVLSGVVATALVATLSISAMAADTTFTDIPADAWYAQDVADVQELGIIQGKGNNLFDPNGTLTISQAITMAAKTRAYYNQEEMPAVDGGSWYSGAVAYATAQGIISGTEFNDYNKNATRAQMAYLFANALPTTEYKAINSITELPDVSSTTKYSTEIFKLYNAGIVAGSDKYGTYQPNDQITRAQATAILNRVVHPENRKTLTLETPNQPDRIMGGYVSNDDGTRGMLIPAYSREYELKALDGIKLGQDSTGVYAEYTAPMLPDEIKDSFTFLFNTIVSKSNGDYFATDAKARNVKPGETVKVYFYSFASEGTQGITKDQIDFISVGVAIMNTSGRHMFVREVSSNDKAHAVGVWYDGEKEVVDYNSSAIFAGIGK